MYMYMYMHMHMDICDLLSWTNTISQSYLVLCVSNTTCCFTACFCDDADNCVGPRGVGRCCNWLTCADWVLLTILSRPAGGIPDVLALT